MMSSMKKEKVLDLQMEMVKHMWDVICIFVCCVSDLTSQVSSPAYRDLSKSF